MRPKRTSLLLWCGGVLQLCLVTGVFSQTEGDVRLLDGPNPNEGRPELYHHGEWYSLCYNYVDSRTPGVICRELGYNAVGALRYYGNSYGRAPAEILRRYLYCSGNEASVSNCTMYDDEYNPCDPALTLGVSCNATASTEKIRLRNGSTPYEGRIEVFRNGVWGTICRRESSLYVFHLINAHILCQQLFGPGYGGSYFPAHETQSRFGVLKSGAIHMNSLQCSGGEDSIFDCYNDYWASRYCSHEDDATVGCVPVPEGCFGYLKGETGNVTSPGYPARIEYANDTECMWKIEIATSRRVILSFPSVSAHEVGNTNYVRVVDSDGYWTLRTSTGSAIPDLLASENVIYITRKTSAGDKGVDFEATWLTQPIYCNGTYWDSNRYISSVGYSGNYPANLDCYYQLRYGENYTVAIYFHHLRLDDAVDGECQDYLQIFDGVNTTNSSMGRFCGSTLPSTLYSTENAIRIHFHSDEVVNSTSTGFRIYVLGVAPVCNATYSNSNPYLRSPGYGYASHYPPNQDCYYLVQFREAFRIYVYFYNFRLDDAVDEVCQDYLEVFDGMSTTNSSMGRFCGSTLPSTLWPSESIVLIHFHSDEIVNSTSTYFYIRVIGLEPDPVVVRYNEESGMFTSPGYPNTYNNDTDYNWIITVQPYNSITLSFFDFQTSCFDNILEIRDGSNRLLANPCGSGTPLPVMTINNNVINIRLRSSPTGSVGNRFNASWTAECRTTFTSSSGTIQSPLHPYPYPDILDCSYVITQNVHGYYVNLTFTSFNLDPRNDGECKDFVQIRDGSSDFSPPLAGPFCGPSLPAVVTSSHNSMWIQFRSDGINNSASTGFAARYTTHIQECESQTLTGEEGVLRSPGYPLPYPHNTYCVWTITVQSGGLVELTFHSFDVGYVSNHICERAYLRLYDGKSVSADSVIDTLCGSAVVPKITSTGRSMTVVLISFTSSSFTYNGFNASYRTVGRADIVQNSLFPYGEAVGDSVLPPATSTMAHVTVPAGLPFGREIEHNIYVGTNGIVSIGNPYSWPNLPHSHKVICVYCAYVNNSGSVGGIFYQLYDTDRTERLVLNKATEEVQEFAQSKTFNATTVLVVTWQRVRQGRYRAVDFTPDQNEGEATFQLALISDGVTSYALIYYAAGNMTWTYRGRWSYVIMGVSDGKGNNYQRNLYTNTERAYRMDAVFGNTGRWGMWFYKVGQVRANPEAACIEWFVRNLKEAEEREKGFRTLPQCPCSHRDVWTKTRFMWIKARTDPVAKTECYRLNRASSAQHYPYGKECCYSLDPADPSYDQVILTAPRAGHALAYNPSYWHLRGQHVREDREGHDVCCNSDIDAYTCVPLFYNLRPWGECRADIPFRFSWLFGDPHIMTLDEREYTFNGWGEYTLVTIDTEDSDFVLQGRTELTVSDSGSVVNATVFTAFGAEENGTRVFVQLDPNTNTSLIIYGNDTDYSVRFQEEGDEFLVDRDDFMMMNDNGSVVVTFPAGSVELKLQNVCNFNSTDPPIYQGVILSLSVGLRSLALAISIPEKFRNQTKGLLGNFNNVTGDDFVLPNGTVLNDTLSDREIHYQFGIAWEVTENNTVMRYSSREGPSDFAHPEFTPIFLDEVSSTTRRALASVCEESDLACMYDYLVSGSQDFALVTKNARATALKDNQDIKNSLPELQVPPNVTVTSNEEVTFRVNAIDPDGDTVNYKLVHDGNGALQIDSQTGEITAVINATEPIDIRVYALDTKNGQSAVQSVSIVMCSGCNDNGVCDFTNLRTSPDNMYFQHALCVCFPAWTGVDCSEDFDACSDSPCHPLRTCTDLTPDEQGEAEKGYTCGDCPEGYKAQDEKSECLDVDECEDESLNDCDRLCNNTAGSYQCSCPPGFRLTSDLRSCADINECAEKTDDCDHICNNTQGSYHCECEEGYFEGNTGQCEQDEDPDSTCYDSPCDYCRVVKDSNNTLVPQCFCNSGYELVDNKTCQDRDECEDDVCPQMCEDLEGSFACSCYIGFQLNEDQRTCSPCPSLTHGPECSLSCDCTGHGVDCHPVTGCVCQGGWTGTNCQDDVDECEEDPDVCGWDQLCTNTNGSYTCSCPGGYLLSDQGVCQDIDECSIDSTCRELEECVNVPGSFICSCVAGYQKSDGICRDVDECTLKTDDCQQLCVNVDGSYNCDCQYGFRLNADRTTCSEISDPCAEEEDLDCDHGCTLEDHTDRAVCFCDAGYRLDSTDQQTCVDIDECLEMTDVCSHTCNNTEGGFTCSCPPGMALDNNERTCVTCPDGTYGFQCSNVCGCGRGASGCDVIKGCQCLPGWTGVKCDRDVNECEDENIRHQCETQNARCQNLQGSYRCQCDPGFVMNTSLSQCQDVDECLTSPCGQICENTAGSYRCLCYSGFSLNATSGDCQDIDECELSSTHSCSHRCDNTPGSYRCSCFHGYVLDNDGVTCSATCTRSDCDDTNGGCYVTDNVEKCFCNTGYILDSDNVTCSLETVDWCAKEACQQVCQVSADNTTFTCHCHQGFLLNQDQRTCSACPQNTYGKGCDGNCSCSIQQTVSCDHVNGTCYCRPGWQGERCTDDVNECETVPCGDHATCNNTVGSYICTCDVGYVKTPDGDCQECPDDTYGEGCMEKCSCVGENSECNHVNGSCSCKAGWKGELCDTDVDECADDTLNNCADINNTICHNTPGSYECRCQRGYRENDEGICIECSGFTFGDDCKQPCGCHQENSQSCDHMNGTCYCKAGWEGTSCDADVDECEMETDDCADQDHAECQNTEGGFECVCQDGYISNSQDRCVEETGLPFQLKVQVDPPENLTEDSAVQSNIRREAQNVIFDMLNDSFTTSFAVEVHNVTEGSLKIYAQVKVPGDAVEISVASLIRGLVDMSKENLTLAGETGSVTVTVGDQTVNSTTSPCDVFRHYGVCDVTQICQMVDDEAQCVDKAEGEDPGLGWRLPVAISLGVGCALLIIRVVVCLCYRPKGKADPSQKYRVASRRHGHSNDGYELDCRRGHVQQYGHRN